MPEDDFKGWWHQAMAVSFGAMAVYNVMRFLATRRRRNAVNVALYVPLAIYESTQAHYHFRQGFIRARVDEAKRPAAQTRGSMVQTGGASLIGAAV